MYTGEKVRMRALRKEDIDFIQSHFNDSSVKETVLLGPPFPATLNDEMKFIEKQTAFGNLSEYNFAFETLEEEKQIGCGGYNYLDWKNRRARIGIWLAPPFWDQGYGTDAVKLLIRFAFNELNMNRVELAYFSTNERGRRCYEKAGFVVEGVLKQAFYRNGIYHNEILMAILKENYKSNE